MFILLRSIIIQVIVFVFIFNAVSMLREMNMLSTSDELQPVAHQLTTLDDKKVTLAAKDKKTIIYFFAPWCKVCNLSIDNLQATYQKTPNLDVIAVALDYVDKEQVEKFTSNHQLTFPVALGNERVKADYKVMGYPSYYVLDEHNTIIARSLGYSSELGLYLRSF